MFKAASVSSPDGGRNCLKIRKQACAPQSIESSLPARMEWMQMCLLHHSTETGHQGCEEAIESRNILNHKRGKPTSPIEPSKPGNQAYVSNRDLVISFAALAAALVLGYLFLNKLVDISREEDCALAHRYNCAAVEVPR